MDSKPHTRANLKWTIDKQVKPKTTKLLKHSGYLSCKDILYRTSKA